MHFGLLFDAVQEILLARQHKKQINNDQYQFSRFRVQCDEIAILFFSAFGPLEQCKFAQKYQIIAKVGSQFCLIVNQETAKNFLEFCPSGKILPNLVTLFPTQFVSNR